MHKWEFADFSFQPHCSSCVDGRQAFNDGRQIIKHRIHCVKLASPSCIAQLHQFTFHHNWFQSQFCLCFFKLVVADQRATKKWVKIFQQAKELCGLSNPSAGVAQDEVQLMGITVNIYSLRVPLPEKILNTSSCSTHYCCTNRISEQHTSIEQFLLLVISSLMLLLLT